MAYSHYLQQCRFLYFIILICQQPTATKQCHNQEHSTIQHRVQQTKEEIKYLIEEGMGFYLRRMSVILDAGARYFCWSLEMEPEHSLTFNYKVGTFKLYFAVLWKVWSSHINTVIKSPSCPFNFICTGIIIRSKQWERTSCGSKTNRLPTTSLSWFCKWWHGRN